jgi:hypothetical protein
MVGEKGTVPRGRVSVGGGALSPSWMGVIRGSHLGYSWLRVRSPAVRQLEGLRQPRTRACTQRMHRAEHGSDTGQQQLYRTRTRQHRTRIATGTVLHMFTYGFQVNLQVSRF